MSNTTMIKYTKLGGYRIMSKYILKINNLNYETVHASLKQFNIRLEYGEIQALIMKSKAEQDLFIEALNRPSSHTANKILFKNEPISNKNRSNIAILEQFPKLIEEFTVFENINFTTFPTRRVVPFIRWKKVKGRSKKILKKLKFNVNLNTKVKHLSENEKKVVYISRIMLENPELIIMQEPFEDLSLENNEKFQDIIRQYQSTGGSILYITERWEEALRIADQISIVSNGKVTDHITSEVAIKNPRKLLSKLEDYSHIIENKPEKDKTQKVLQAIFNAAEVLSSEYELNDVLLFLAEEIKTILHADGCTIKLIDERTGSEINNFERKNDENIKFRLKPDTVEHFLKLSNIFYSNINDKHFSTLFEVHENIQTFIAAPVSIRNQVTGIIQVYYKIPYVYSDDEFKYLSTMARHTAIAIEDTRLMGRSAFIQESHHRIKNNLQSIVGLVSLQKEIAKNNKDISIEDTLDTIITRIQSIASVHKLLSMGSSGRSIVNVKEIIESVVQTLDIDPDITINLDLTDLFISYNKATSIALIVNELVTNCLKHAFTDIGHGQIIVSCKRREDNIILNVCDNGKGFPSKQKMKSSNSLGFSIIQGIVLNEFKGTLEIVEKTKNCILITLPFDTLFNE